ncbi:Krueppel-like factor 7 isoform X1 [Scomber scombrus]|uniref:Krueppel-like factor 7 isoform X1 n=1 Tax=Scomber scombrus TaxID=13677 RepID=A0AAV1PEP1_SCOSC
MRILLPTQTRFVTPGSTELHFYSDRHVRDRVRLHLRRVTENNNTERRTRETTTAKSGSIDRTRVDTQRAGKSRRLPRKRGGIPRRWPRKAFCLRHDMRMRIIWVCGS